jgi:NAD(P)-dependent dehydrogenase (short-subunit alcohol dehydrogenase family)
MQLTDRVALVTGASAGIGRAYALALAGAGVTTVAVARTLGGGEATRNTLAEVARAGEELPGTLATWVCDVEVEADVVGTVARVVAEFGRLDVLVNNAALMTSFDPLRVGTEDWDRMMRTNLRGPYLFIREAAPQMMAQRSGGIVNITARAGGFTSRGHRPSDGTLVYGVTKAALNRLTFFFAEELAPYGIAVNALSPGIVATDTAIAANPRLAERRGKPPTPEVLGPALLCLATQTADTLTGQILHTDDFGQTWP